MSALESVGRAAAAAPPAPLEFLTRRHLDLALAALERRLLSVGVLERLNETAAVFAYQLGWDADWADWAKVHPTISNWRDSRARSAEWSGHRSGTVGGATAARILQLNSLDAQLYSAANALLTRRVAALRGRARALAGAGAGAGYSYT